jgi:glyoxylase-like metal-dependent hydrolase (beta-lactamase superfamily II)
MAVDHGIYTIDTGFYRPGFDASHLIVEGGRAAFIDTGTADAVPQLLAALAAHGLTPAAVDWVILTHVHLDHAAGAGALLTHLPNARVVVHPRGARHMIDPTRLLAGASAVYGAEEVRRSYGRVLPIPATRLVEAADGHVVELAGRSLLCLDTPGHARHHLSVWDERSRAFFSGDTFGVCYRELAGADGALLVPTTTPVQFEPDALHASIERMLGFQPERMFLTHYGPVGEVPRLAAELHEQIDAMVAIARAHAGDPARHARIVADLTDLYTRQARRHGCACAATAVRQWLAMDIELNAQGLEVWLDRSAVG